MSDWTTVGQRSQVEPDAPLGVTVGTQKVGIYDVDGTLHAAEDICPHAAALLTQGFVESCEVECPLHNAVFDVTSGKHLRGEPCRDLKTFPVRVVGEEIQIQITLA
jgi:nitrite reductase/ring-hydroxylating ferredoxin subunit